MILLITHNYMYLFDNDEYSCIYDHIHLFSSSLFYFFCFVFFSFRSFLLSFLCSSFSIYLFIFPSFFLSSLFLILLSSVPLRSRYTNYIVIQIYTDIEKEEGISISLVLFSFCFYSCEDTYTHTYPTIYLQMDLYTTYFSFFLSPYITLH